MKDNDLYIERTYYEKKLWNTVFELPADVDGDCISLHGVSSVGKTTLIKKLAERFNQTEHPYVYYYYTTIAGKESRWDFWQDLFVKMQKDFTCECMENAPNPLQNERELVLSAFKWFSERELSEIEQSAVSQRLYERVFSNLRLMGFKIILVIDEFDMCDVMCKEGDGQFFIELFGLSKKAGKGQHHSVITVSKKPFIEIDRRSGYDDMVESIFEDVCIEGFNNIEMQRYFDSYADLECGVLDDDSKHDVIYYCGRNPGLLVTMREAIDDYFDQYGIIKVHKAAKMKRLLFQSVYDRIIGMMQSEQIGHFNSHTISCFDAFIQCYLSPESIDKNTRSFYIDALLYYGFIVLSMPEDSSQGLFLSYSMQTEYEPLSGYFLEYLKYNFI